MLEYWSIDQSRGSVSQLHLFQHSTTPVLHYSKGMITFSILFNRKKAL
jgi:hypothetical protein